MSDYKLGDTVEVIGVDFGAEDDTCQESIGSIGEVIEYEPDSDYAIIRFYSGYCSTACDGGECEFSIGEDPVKIRVLKLMNRNGANSR